MIRPFGQAPFGRSDKHAVMSMFTDPGAELFYTVMGNQVCTNNPVSGELAYAQLKPQSYEPLAFMFGQQSASPGAANITVPPDLVDLFGIFIQNDFARIMVFYNGVKLHPCGNRFALGQPVINSASVGGDGLGGILGHGDPDDANAYVFSGFQVSTLPVTWNLGFVSTQRAYQNSDVIELIFLSDANLPADKIGTGSFYSQWNNRTDNVITGVLADSGYVKKTVFYNNALVFKNGLYQRAQRDYFLDASGGMYFASGDLVDTDIVELYTLSVSNNNSRMGFSDYNMDDCQKWIMPTFAELRLKEV